MKILQFFGFLVILSQHVSNALTEYETLLMTGEKCKNLERTSPGLRLKTHLFCEYDPGVRPTPSHQTANNVTLKLLPMLLEFDEWTSTMTLHSWMIISWNDWYLTWKASDFGGITSLHVRSNELWVPDISVYNSGDFSSENTIPTTNCLVSNNGKVSCVPSLKYTVRCNTDFSAWPYDTHKCRINLGSWTHSGEEVSIHLDKKGYQMDGYTNNTQWDMKIVKAYKVLQKYKCCPNDTYPMVVYEFALSRHPGMMHSTFITPAAALALLTITVLWLDSRSTERMAVSSVNLICHLLCIFDLHWQLPHNGANPPNILLFYRDSLLMAAFALILTALLRKLQEMSTDVPYWISSTTSFVLNNRAGRFLILTNDESKISDTSILNNEPEENTDLPKSSVKTKESSWRHFAAIIEWLSFFSVIFVYIIIFFTLVPLA